MEKQDRLQDMITELRRGSLTLAVLACLRQPHYGYALLQTLQTGGIDMEANTLYPLLRRLETQGLLTSSWDTSEARPRKYYTISDQGKAIYEGLLAEWHRMQHSVDTLCKEES